MSERVAPLVSVALAAYNNEHTIRTAVQSVLDQTLNNIELIIVDDGSPDATSAVIDRFRDPRIRVLREPMGNLGHAARLNQCVRAARGLYVARMDGDDVMYPERLERQVQFLESNPRTALVGAGAVLFKDNGVAYGLYPRATTHVEISYRPWWGFPLAHPTWMARREWFLAHPYREARTRCEDQELLLNSLSNSRFAALDEPLIGYRMDRVAATKLARGRFNYCLALIRRVSNMKSARIAARGIAVHSLAFFRDLTLDATGTMNEYSRWSFRPLDADSGARWEAVWRHANRDSGDRD